MINKLAGAFLLASVGMMPSSAFSQTSVEAVENFYDAATTDGMCDVAMLLRPNYTQAQCKKLKKVKIRTLKSVKEDEKEAIVYLNMRYETTKPLVFKGHLHLYKKNNRWIIIGEDYKASKIMSRSRYIKTYMGTALKEKKEKVVQADVLSGNHREVLNRLAKQYPEATKKYPTVLIDISEQELYLYSKKRLKGMFPVSSSEKGEGSREGSEMTPLGAHSIKEKFGDKALFGTVFDARKDTGNIADIITTARRSEKDYVTSRILWLDGLEDGKNKGGNVDSYKRYIYIHGTDEEGRIGKKASHGCIRMYNKDVIKIFGKLPVGSLVYIGL